MKKVYDVVIVGAGSAGCALAARLTEDPSRSVLLVEAGHDYPTAREYPIELRHGGVMKAAMPGHPANWMYEGAVLDGSRQPVTRGKVVGGSSAINGGVFTRGLPADFEEWAAGGCEPWSFDHVLPYFTRLERDLDKTDSFHGTSGPVPVARPPESSWAPVARTFVDACRAAGFPEDADMNAPASVGVGALPMNVVDGIRVNAAIAYLEPIRTRPNLELRANTVVERLVLEGTRAVGLKARTPSGSESIFGGEVVLSMGAVQSPHVMMMSGIGAVSSLESIGIEPVHDLPGVGRNFSDHCSVTVRFEAPRTRFDPLSEPWTQVGMHFCSRPDDPSDLMLLPSSIPLNASMLHGSSLLERLKFFKVAAGGMSASKLYRQARYGWEQSITCLSMRSEPRGILRPTSSDPLQPPRIEYNYLSTETDRASIRHAVRTAVMLVRSAPYRELGARLLAPRDVDADSDSSLDAFIYANLGTALHLSGTCRMGTDISQHAVDPLCRVHGIDGLRVVDTSIMPTVVRRSPAATAIMIGERASAFFG